MLGTPDRRRPACQGFIGGPATQISTVEGAHAACCATRSAKTQVYECVEV
jgi:hypothetical protein